MMSRGAGAQADARMPIRTSSSSAATASSTAPARSLNSIMRDGRRGDLFTASRIGRSTIRPWRRRKRSGGKDTALDRVLAIGDSVRTDLTGAHAYGIDLRLFVTRGIHAGDFEGIEQMGAAEVKELVRPSTDGADARIKVVSRGRLWRRMKLARSVAGWRFAELQQSNVIRSGGGALALIVSYRHASRMSTSFWPIRARRKAGWIASKRRVRRSRHRRFNCQTATTFSTCVTHPVV